MTAKDAINEAAEAHTNLTMFAAVVALLESGCVCGHSNAADKIIGICQAEQQNLLHQYDRYTAIALATLTKDNPHG
jgi:hypothetical protein